MIDAPDLKRETFWVRENELHHGENASAAVPYRDADFVLYSVLRAPGRKRNDVDQLPFFEMYERVKTEAAGTKPENWENAKVSMSALYQTMVTSPDLTDEQADQLNDEYVARMVRIHERALGNVKHGAAETKPDPMANTRRKALNILKL